MARRSAAITYSLILSASLSGACNTAAKEKAHADSVAQAAKVQQEAMTKHIADSLRIVDSTRRADSIAAELAKPKVIQVVNTSGLDVPAGGSQSYGFQLAGAGVCHVTGKIETVSGGNKDVRVYVMTADEFTNWKNSPDGKARVLFQGDQQSVTSFDVDLPSPGIYRIVISNRFSVITGKTVRGSSSVTCVGGPEPRALDNASTPTT